MHVTHPHPRRTLVAAMAALVLALLALMPAMAEDLSLGIGGGAGSADSAAPAGVQSQRAEPAWQDNPFARPLLQAPAAR